VTPIAIVTVVRNGEATIRGCLESVQKQHVNTEHIIVDGNSTDKTCEIVRTFMNDLRKTKEQSEPPISYRLISEPDGGIYDAMNKGIKAATGDVVGILNADDSYADDTVLKSVLGLFRNSAVDSCYGDLVYVDPDDLGKVVRRWQAGKFSSASFYLGWMPPHPTFFVRRRIYDQFGGFNLSVGTSADYELMLRFLVKHNISSVYIPKVLVRMRRGGASNKSLANHIRANRTDRLAWRVNGLRPYPWTLWLKPVRKLNQFFVARQRAPSISV
jgi:glycosyltransferase involved in cell wall biosynthesis